MTLHMPTPSADLLPPEPVTAAGAPRMVAVEIEFFGPSAEAAARALAAAFGGALRQEDPHAFEITGGRLGRFALEADLRHAHPQRHPRLRPRLGPRAAAWLGRLTAGIVPRELISQPRPIAAMAEIDEVCAVLRRAGARGSGRAPFGSLGLHFNIDPPALDAPTIAAYLKAAIILEPSLRARTAGGDRRLARVLPPPFPTDYARRVRRPDYRPDLATLTGDYLVANPTRRRSLDLLPLLRHLDEERVRSALPLEKIGSRPVFHYRLPLAYPGDPAWSVVPAWQAWLEVERLACDRERLEALGAADEDDAAPVTSR